MVLRRRYFLIFIFLLISLTLIFIFLFSQREYVFNNLSDKEPLEYPDNIYIDENNNIYFSDREMTRVTKIDLEGKVKARIRGNLRENGFYRVSEIVSDKEGNIYLINFVYSENNIYVDRTEVLMFDEDGNFIKSIFDVTCKDEKEKEEYYNSFPYAIMGLTTIENNIYFFSADLTGNLILWWYDKELDKVKRLNVYPITKDNSFVRVFLSSDGDVFLIKKDGHLYTYDLKKNIKRVDLKIEKPKIWSITESDRYLYSSDIFSRKIFILKNDKTNEFIINKKDEKSFYYNISSNKSYIVGINDYKNTIDIFDKNGNIIKEIDSIKIKSTELLIKFLTWGAFVLGLILFLYLIYFVYNKILGKYLSLIIKEIVIFVPLLIISLVFTSIRVYNSLFVKYENEIENELSAIAYFGARIINPENIMKINSPSDYQNEFYNNLQSELVALLNNYEDPWNENLFNTVYVLKDGLFYILCNDSTYYGSWYPYTKHPEAHYRSYKEGVIQTAKYKDQHGDYFVAVAPIKDKNEKIIALYEVGFYQDYAQEFYNIFRKKLIISSVLSTIFYIFIFVVSTYIILKSLKKLKNGVKKITNGNFGIEISINRKDELGDLANGFNYMSKKLRDYIVEITDLNKSLEKKVEERTRELKDAYKEIEKRNITIENDIKMASIIQKNMLPKVIPTTYKTGFYAFYKPMDLMGGDFYDFTNPEEKKIGIFISDVSGHGVPAAFITSMMKTLITTLPKDNMTPARFLSFINENIYANTSGNFITAFYGLCDEESGVLTYSKASHPEPILIKNNGQIVLLEGKGKFLGIFKDLKFEEYKVKLELGDKVILYTDGLTEAINKEGIQFEDKLLEIIHLNKQQRIINLVDIIVEELEKYQVSQNDDVCIIGMEVKR